MKVLRCKTEKGSSLSAIFWDAKEPWEGWVNVFTYGYGFCNEDRAAAENERDSSLLYRIHVIPKR